MRKLTWACRRLAAIGETARTDLSRPRLRTAFSLTCQNSSSSAAISVFAMASPDGLAASVSAAI